MRVRKLEPLSFEESESRALLMKQWTRYKLTQHANEMNTIQTAMLSQQVALQELRNESEELYQQAILVRQERRKLCLFSIILTHDPLHDGVALYNLFCTLDELSPSIKILRQSLSHAILSSLIFVTFLFKGLIPSVFIVNSIHNKLHVIT